MCKRALSRYIEWGRIALRHAVAIIAFGHSTFSTKYVQLVNVYRSKTMLQNNIFIRISENVIWHKIS